MEVRCCETGLGGTASVYATRERYSRTFVPAFLSYADVTIYLLGLEKTAPTNAETLGNVYENSLNRPRIAYDHLKLGRSLDNMLIAESVNDV
jgi:hypothetical protein